MAIARVTSLTGYVGSATSLTIPLTLTASADLLVVFVMTTLAARSISSITWAGGADFSSTKIGPATVATNFKMYAAYKVAPTIGTNNVVITIDSAGEIYGGAVAYSGTKQTGLFDASALNTSSLVQTVNTATSNSWAVCCGLADGGSLAASTNSTQLSTIQNTAWGMFDSNGIISTGGFSMTQTGVGNKGGVIVSIAPAGTVAVKSVNAIAQASIKSIDAVTLANIKSINNVANV